MQVPIASDVDIVGARMAARELALEVGFDGAELVMIATAVSEVARNIVEYAKPGEVSLEAISNGYKNGLQVVARDGGPGIADVSLAMQDGYSSARGLGLGLPGARRLMDEFQIESQPGKGTSITMKKWLP
ncbi:MAG: anti-sigma regulatory factor [Bryobacteraceae bacterium]